MNTSSEQMEKVTQGLIEACDEISANCSKSVDALVQATSVASKGCEEFNRKLGSLVQDSVARTVDTGKTMLAAKNLQEVAEIQTELMKTLFDSWMAGATHLSQISARVTQEAFEPVIRHANDTVTKAAQKAQQGRAA
jgi:phasin family protein